MKEIKLTQQQVALVDDEDYEYLNQWNWYAQKSANTFYAVRNDYSNNKHKRVFMHKLIMTMCNKKVDHIDRNSLNNQKSNLRYATRSQNSINVIHKNLSGYRGVSYHKRLKKFIVQIRINGRNRHFGYFDNLILAAKKYNFLAKKYHGEFAILNSI
jgi:hypothetical protein